MPKYVELDGIGLVEMSDDITPDEMLAIADELLPRTGPPSEPATMGRGASAANAFMQGGGVGVGQTISGLARMVQSISPRAMVPPGVGMPSESVLPSAAPTAAEIKAKLANDPVYQSGISITEGAAEAFPTNPAYRGEFFADVLPQSAGQMVPTIMAGAVGGPLAAMSQYGLSQAESEARAAEESGAPEKADIVFLANLGIGGLSELALGVPARIWKLVRSARLAGLEPSTARKMVLAELAKGAAREAGQEGLEQTGQNVVAQQTYDPQRGTLEGVPQSMAAGALLGGPVAAGATSVGLAGRYDAGNPDASTDAPRPAGTGSVFQPVTGPVAPATPTTAAEIDALLRASEPPAQPSEPPPQEAPPPAEPPVPPAPPAPPAPPPPQSTGGVPAPDLPQVLADLNETIAALREQMVANQITKPKTEGVTNAEEVQGQQKTLTPPPTPTPGAPMPEPAGAPVSPPSAPPSALPASASPARERLFPKYSTEQLRDLVDMPEVPAATKAKMRKELKAREAEEGAAASSPTTAAAPTLPVAAPAQPSPQAAQLAKLEASGKAPKVLPAGRNVEQTPLAPVGSRVNAGSAVWEKTEQGWRYRRPDSVVPIVATPAQAAKLEQMAFNSRTPAPQGQNEPPKASAQKASSNPDLNQQVSPPGRGGSGGTSFTEPKTTEELRRAIAETPEQVDAWYKSLPAERQMRLLESPAGPILGGLESALARRTEKLPPPASAEGSGGTVDYDALAKEYDAKGYAKSEFSNDPQFWAAVRRRRTKTPPPPASAEGSGASQEAPASSQVSPATTAPAQKGTGAMPEAGAVGGFAVKLPKQYTQDEWETAVGDWVTDADSFYPARNTGVRDYDLSDAIQNFADAARQQDASIADFWAGYKKTADLTPSQAKKIQAILKEKGLLAKPTQLQKLEASGKAPKQAAKLREKAKASPAATSTVPATPPVVAEAKMEQQIEDVKKTEGVRDAREIKDELVARLEQAMEAAPGRGKITIQIPGDGTFTVWNTKESIGELLARAKKIKVGPDNSFRKVGPKVKPGSVKSDADAAIAIYGSPDEAYKRAKAQGANQSLLDEIYKSTNAGKLAGDAARAKSLAEQERYSLNTLNKSIAKLESKKRISAEQAKDIDLLKSAVAVSQKKLDSLEQTAQQLARQAAEARAELEAATARPAPATEQAANLPVTTDAEVKAAEERLGGIKIKLNEKRGEAGFTNIPQIIADLAVAGAKYFYNGARTFGQWSKAMVARFGAEFKPWLREAWAQMRAAVFGGQNSGPYHQKKFARALAYMIRGQAVPAQFLDIQDRALGMKKYMEETLRLLIENTRKRMKAEFPNPADFAAAMQRLEAYWLGQGPLNAVGSPALQRAAEAFRQELDALTQTAINNGLVPDSQVATWLGNVGEWMKRTYLAFNEDADWNYDQLKKRKDRGDAEITRIWNAAEAYLRQQNPNAAPGEIEAMMRALIDRREVESVLLGAARGGDGSGFGVDIGSLIRRKDIPAPLLEWMGQIRDPFLRAKQSSKWMAQFIARNLMQREMAKIGLEAGWLSETPDGRNHVELYPNRQQLVPVRHPITGEEVKTPSGNVEAQPRAKIDRRHEPLHGLFTSQEMADALAKFDGMMNTGLALYRLPGRTMDLILKGVGLWKLGKVGLNPYSYMVNSFGAITTRLAAGALNPIHMAQAFDAVLSRHMTIDAGSSMRWQTARANFLLATKMGVTGKGILTREMDASFNRESEPEAVKRLVAALGDWMQHGGEGARRRIAKAILDTAKLPGDVGIRFIDDVARVSAFLDELALSRKANPKFTEQQHAEWAAERASNIYQTYERLPQGLRDASNLGMLSPFVSFKIEMLRNLIHIGYYGWTGLKSNNPHLRRDGAQKLVGLAAMSMAPIVLAALSRHENIEGDDDEEKRQKVRAMQRWFVPPWDRGEELVIKRWDEDNLTVQYIPIGYLLPTYELMRLPREAIKAAQDDNPERAINKMLEGIYADYFGGGPLSATAEAVGNVRFGRAAKVTEAEGMTGAADRAEYLWRALRPGVAQMASEIIKANTGERGYGGREYTMNEVASKTLGLRVRTVNLAEALPFVMREFAARWRSASAVASMEERRTNNESKIDAAYEYKARKQDELRRDYEQLLDDLDRLGMTHLVKDAQKEANLPADLRRNF